MKTLVIGGTGTVGKEVVMELLKEGKALRVLTTSKEKAKSQPAGVEAVVGNTGDPESLQKAFLDIDRLFMVNAHTQTEVEQAMNAVAAAKNAGVKKIVYQSIHRAHEFQTIPHVKSKVLIENAIKDSGVNYTFVCPNNFYQNDFMFHEAVTKYGVYPQPIGNIGLSRNDVRDIAEVAVKALFTSDLDGLSIPIVGPDALTGNDIANILTGVLDYRVQYAGNDLVSWAAQTKLFVPEWMVEDWRIMYGEFQKRGLIASDEEVALLTDVLGRPPKNYVDFLKENKSLFQRVPAVAES